MKYFSYILSFYLIFLISCNGNNRVNITSHYIEFTKKPLSINSFQLSLITVTDNKMPPQQYTEVEGNKYGILTDNNFKISNKIYFDRKQEGFKWVMLNSGKEVDSIGQLMNNHWYVIKNLHNLGYKILVYISKNSKSNIYIDQRENW